MIYKRNCPSCSKVLTYTCKNSLYSAEKKKSFCIPCGKTKNKPKVCLSRKCPNCDCIINYTNENNKKSADKNNTRCKECSILKRRNYSGINNPFYGKKHSQELIDQIIIKNKNRERTQEEIEITNENLKLGRLKGKKSNYAFWLEKFGKEIADEKMQQFKNTLSEKMSGSNNPMFGKETPQGSGNGWSGWYNNWFFRSLRELSYMINIIEKENLDWKSKKAFKISYLDHKGTQRTYLPDFIIENKIVEIKPSKLQNSPKVLAKKRAAEKVAQDLGMIYEIVDPLIISNEEIKTLYINGKIKFLPKYEEKFKKEFL